MKRLFTGLPNKFFIVPDKTRVNPFLNPKDVESGLPWDLLDGLSVAAGFIAPKLKSEIHVHPYTTQVLSTPCGFAHCPNQGPRNRRWTLRNTCSSSSIVSFRWVSVGRGSFATRDLHPV